MARLAWALRDVDAPKARLRNAGNYQAHTFKTGTGKVWYEPKAVVKWYLLRVKLTGEKK
jgi:hypothetical protein